MHINNTFDHYIRIFNQGESEAMPLVGTYSTRKMFPPIAQLHFLQINPHTTHNSSIRPYERANARNVSFLTLYGGQFTISTQLIQPNYPVDLDDLEVAEENFCKRRNVFGYQAEFCSVNQIFMLGHSLKTQEMQKQERSCLPHFVHSCKEQFSLCYW